MQKKQQKQQQKQPYRAAYKKMPSKKKRSKTPLKVLALLVGFCALGVLATLLLSLGKQPAVSSSVSVSLVPSSVPVSSVVSQPPALPQPPSSPYNEADLPLLLNAENAVPKTLELDLVSVGNGQTMQRNAAKAFTAMQAAAKADGVTLTPISGYRSNQRQTNNYNASIQRYLSQGYTQQKAEEETRRYYAIPGTSEHEAGLAIDIDSIEESFENTPAFAWLQQNCTEYGFILRYAKTTEAITGIAYEPWHYRYVGANHAFLMQQQGFTTLEEYMEHQTAQEASSVASYAASSPTGSQP
ncbi:M15 family metallopeptidase [Ruminococcaceae bacterium OttesenSCG-928-A16]|nr:M15 family metallopeptidase [Ruminococcaceae bacterium OttesenSCG-928-A16]